MFQTTHLAYLQTCASQPAPPWTGTNVKRWANYLFQHTEQMPDGANAMALDDKNITREEIYAYVANPQNSLANCVITILAWGGMHRAHGVSAMHSWRGWEHMATL